MRTLLILRGLPGSGKSTMAKDLLQSGGYNCHFEADMFFEKTGTYIFDTKLLPMAHQWCQHMTEFCLEMDNAVIVSNTFTTEKEIQPYFDICKRLNIVPDIFVCTGNYKSVHNVPDTTIEKMKERWVNQLKFPQMVLNND